MSNPRPTPRRPSAAIRFRTEIEKAEAEGVARKNMTLELTFADVSELKRDRGVAVSDISFTGGVMTFLGVKIVQGGVSTSVLSVATGRAPRASSAAATPAPSST